jgi:hypothetical protein
MSLIIGNEYTLNRRIFKKYVDEGWASRIYDSGVTKVRITEEYIPNKSIWYSLSKYRKQKYYIVSYGDYVLKNLYIPEECLAGSINEKLDRIL